MTELKATTDNMITWKFQCLKCGYKFRAIEPKALYDAYTECAMCGSKDFEKKVTKRSER